jgi:hypothetical protein
MVPPTGAGLLHVAATAMGIVMDGELTDDHAVLVQAALDSEADRIFHRYRSDHELDPTLDIPPRSPSPSSRCADAAKPSTNTPPSHPA